MLTKEVNAVREDSTTQEVGEGVRHVSQITQFTQSDEYIFNRILVDVEHKIRMLPRAENGYLATLALERTINALTIICASFPDKKPNEI